MDLLILESTNDDPVVKNAVRGIGPVRAAQTQADTSRLSKTNSNQPIPAPGYINHTTTSTSIASVSTTGSGKTMVTTTVLEGSKEDKIMYPFRIKHLGKAEVFTLYASTAQSRQDWCDKILEAKTRHAASLFKQNAEP